MKTKTKEVLAGIGWGLAVTGGLAGAGVGIYAIATMRHPYINQWTDLADEDEQYDPIVSWVNTDYVKKTMGVEKLTPEIVEQFYWQKISVTPEIFVEDLLSDVSREMISKKDDYRFDKNRVRVSDPVLKKDDSDNYRISFRWNQELDYYHNLTSTNLVWSVKFEDLPVTLTNSNSNWAVSFDLTDTSWKAFYTISEATGDFSNQDYLENQEVNSRTIDAFIRYDFFKNFDYDNSYYLKYVYLNN